MSRSTSVLAAFGLGLLAMWFADCGHAGDDRSAPKTEETVAAKRYTTWVYAQAGRGGHWIEELFFPEQGVCANVEMRVVPKGETIDFTHVVNAFHGTIRNKFTTTFASSELSESAVEDVPVPAALAKAIFEAADLQRRLEAARHEVGPRLSESGLCRDVDGDGKPQKADASVTK